MDVLKKKIVSQNRIRNLDRSVLFGSQCDRPPGFGYQKCSLRLVRSLLGDDAPLHYESIKPPACTALGTLCTHIFYSLSQLLFSKFVPRLK